MRSRVRWREKGIIDALDDALLVNTAAAGIRHSAACRASDEIGVDAG